MILLVEDDVAIGRSVAQGLTARGFAVTWLRGAALVAKTVAAGEIAVVILDIGLPDGDGLELCRRLRAAGHAMPVLVLTARGGLDDRLEGFDAGADDYLAKPFAFAELAARVGVLARRAGQMAPAPVTLGPLTIDPARGAVLRDGAALALEPKAQALLARLALARGHVVARQVLIDAGWGADADVGDNTLDVAISGLRRRLATLLPEIAVRAVKGQGYRLDLPPSYLGST